MSKKIFLNTTAIDNINNIYGKKYNKFYLGKFCISDKINLDEFDKLNCLKSNWDSRKKNILEYKYLKTITKKLFKFVASQLNIVHEKNYNNKYWKIIIYPWICYYVNTTYDRWKIISLFNKKKKQGKNFFIHQYDLPQNFLHIKNMNDWYDKIASDTLNNFLFAEIIKFKNLNIKIHKKHNTYNFLRPTENINYKKFNFENFLDKILSYIGIHFNKLYIDQFYFPRKSFVKLCFENRQIPAKNISTFKENFKNIKFDHSLRDQFKTKKFLNSNFERFLYEKLRTFIPMSYLENYKNIILKHKSKVKKKIFVGMYSVHWNDEFKIYLSECLLKGSKYFHSNHGAGIEAVYDSLHNHFNEISDKVIVQSKSNLKLNEIYLGSTIFKERKKKKNSEKLLINFHETERYLLRVPLTTPHLDVHIDNFKMMAKSLGNLKKDILKNLKFRSKGKDGYSSELRFSKIFGKNRIEKASDLSYFESISNSKIVICTIPQTSFTECIFYNIPTILIVDNLGYFDNNSKRNLLKIFLKNKIAFRSYSQAVRFLNKNWDNIDRWWNKKEIQKIRKIYLKRFYDTSGNIEENWGSFLKKSLKFKNS